MLENVALVSKYSQARHFFCDCVRHFDHVITTRLGAGGGMNRLNESNWNETSLVFWLSILRFQRNVYEIYVLPFLTLLSQPFLYPQAAS